MNVTFEDKNKLNKDGIHNRVRDVDMNEIKNAINSKQDALPGGGIFVGCGGWPGTGNLFPETGGTGVGGMVMTGNIFDISVECTLGGVLCPVGTEIRALIDNPAQGVVGLAWKVRS